MELGERPAEHRPGTEVVVPYAALRESRSASRSTVTRPVYGQAVISETRWFRVADGGDPLTNPLAGQVILSGWYLESIATPSGWFRVAVCPRCFALVLNGGSSGHPVSGRQYETTTFNRYLRGHERWHAATDFPVPEELR